MDLGGALIVVGPGVDGEAVEPGEVRGELRVGPELRDQALAQLGGDRSGGIRELLEVGGGQTEGSGSALFTTGRPR